MGANQDQKIAQDDQTIYESLVLTEQQKSLADRSSHRPDPAYARLADKIPVMYPKTKVTFDQLQAKQAGNQTSSTIKGEKLPVYELIAMPGCFYDGEWQKGLPHGSGKVRGTNGIYYQGTFEEGMASGKNCLFIYPDGSHYRGSFRYNTFDGFGTFTYRPNGTTYTGNWRDDKPHGEGLQTYPDESKYEGTFHNGKKHGTGKFTFADGKIYKGTFLDGMFDGEGTIVCKGKRSQFRGTFSKGLKVKGKLVTEYGQYNGQFKNGLMHDEQGEFKWNDEKRYKGGFEFGEMHGQGTLYAKDFMIEGRWQRGRNVKVTKMVPNKPIN